MIRGGYWGGAWGLSWAGAWGEAWLLLNQPYQELSLKGQVFVRSYLTRIHSIEVAERIVSVAALNNISVIDAEVVVAAKTGEARLEAVKKRPPNRIQSQVTTVGCGATVLLNRVADAPTVTVAEPISAPFAVTVAEADTRIEAAPEIAPGWLGAEAPNQLPNHLPSQLATISLRSTHQSCAFHSHSYRRCEPSYRPGR